MLVNIKQERLLNTTTFLFDFIKGKAGSGLIVWFLFHSRKMIP